jgi:hypothetical protein
LLLSIIYLIPFLHCVSLYLPAPFCTLFVFISFLFLLVSPFLSTSFSRSFRLSFYFYIVILTPFLSISSSARSPFSDQKCHPQHTVPLCACLLQAPIRGLREVRQVYGHGHVTFNSLRQFVLVTDDTEAERLYQSINCSTVDDKYVFRYSVRRICTGVHLLQMSCCCRRRDHELHGVRTAI